jgi:hypothetical protein
VPMAHADVPESSDVAAWGRALDRLEADAVAAGQLLDGHVLTDGEPWQPPAGIGPLPAELAQRAVALLDRMLPLHGELATAQEQIRRQLAATRRVTEATSQVRRTSLYIDTSA